MQKRSIQIVPDAATVAATAAELIVGFAADAISQRGVFSIALSGGNTPKTLFELLASDTYSHRIDWNKCEIYFSDERCVPPTDKESNFRMAAEALLDHVPIIPDHIHRMKGEMDPQAAAKEYGQLLQEKFADGGLDLILLGMGDDGHTASLFPGTAALSETKHRCVANFVPKVNMWRLTMTFPFLNQARQIMVLLAGAAKAQRVAEVLEGPPDPDRLPIQRIEPRDGHLLWLMDAGAAGMVEQN